MFMQVLKNCFQKVKFPDVFRNISRFPEEETNEEKEGVV